MNHMSNYHPLGDANVYHLTSFLVNVMFLFLVNTVNLTPGLYRLLPVVFVLLGNVKNTCKMCLEDSIYEENWRQH